MLNLINNLRKHFKYETKTQPLAPLHVVGQRIFANVMVGALVLMLFLGIGVFGYHYTSDISWIDSFHNASMILSGMGPVVELKTNSAKIFSSIYAIFSGVLFVTNMGFVLSPVAHRLFHKLHINEEGFGG